MRLVFKVDGMGCKNCSNAVSAAIKTTYPNVIVDVELANKTVTVEGDNLAEQAIISIIEDAGYDVIE